MQRLTFSSILSFVNIVTAPKAKMSRLHFYLCMDKITDYMRAIKVLGDVFAECQASCSLLLPVFMLSLSPCYSIVNYIRVSGFYLILRRQTGKYGILENLLKWHSVDWSSDKILKKNPSTQHSLNSQVWRTKTDKLSGFTI